MRRDIWPASLAGVAATALGLGAAELVGGLLHRGTSPVLAVGEAVIEFAPGGLAEAAIQVLGTWDKPLLVAGTVLITLLVGAVAGLVARRTLLGGLAVLVTLGLLAGGSILAGGGGSDDVVTTGVAVVVATLTLAWLAPRAPATGVGGSHPTRRGFLLLTGTTAVGAVALAVAGNAIGRGRRLVEDARRALRLPVHEPPAPAGVEVDLAGVGPWRTPNEQFYRIDTRLSVPEVDPKEWRLRIHGMVDREVEIGYDELIDLGLRDTWLTLTCVSNEVGADLVGNAWWSGVPVARLLDRAGVSREADAVLQTSVDGWTCSTPLEALTDGRDALLAVAMNGQPLPLEHGFPVRMVVPGLYGYVSATKWLVDLEVTRFEEVSAYWTERGWSERGPIKLSSRIDVPRFGAEVERGRVGVGGVAWAQGVGIDRVEVRVDEGPWHEARLAAVPSVDTWRQWAWTWPDATPGEHRLTVRATDANGKVQIRKEQGVVPDGATGWHQVTVDVE